jgi:hypothetical protein
MQRAAKAFFSLILRMKVFLFNLIILILQYFVYLKV